MLKHGMLRNTDSNASSHVLPLHEQKPLINTTTLFNEHLYFSET